MSAPPLTRARAFRLAWPMFFANAAVPLAGLVDTAVIGAVGDAAALGGVALGTTLYNIFYWSFYFLRAGSTGLTAQAAGAGDAGELQRILVRALTLSAALGLLVVLVRGLIVHTGFAILQGTPAVESAGATYFAFRALGAPAAYAVFALTGWLIGRGQMKAVLAINITFSLVNIALDLWFVLGATLGVAGVAVATAIADVAAAGVGIAAVWAVVRRDGGWQPAALARPVLWHLPALRRLVAVNGDMMVRSWALLVGFSWFANTGARQGASVLAGNHVLLQIVTIWAFVLDAYAFTAEAAVGYAVGARSLPRMRQAIRVTTELAMGSAVIFFLLTLFGGPPVLRAWIADPEARASAIRFLPYCASIPIAGAVAWQLDGIFTGAMRSAAMRNASVAAVGLYLVADFVLTSRFGPHGMWSAFVFFYVARAGMLLIGYPALERELMSPPYGRDPDAATPS